MSGDPDATSIHGKFRGVRLRGQVCLFDAAHSRRRKSLIPSAGECRSLLARGPPVCKSPGIERGARKCGRFAHGNVGFPESLAGPYKRFGRREIADVRLPGERRVSCPWRGARQSAVMSGRVWCSMCAGAGRRSPFQRREGRSLEPSDIAAAAAKSALDGARLPNVDIRVVALPF
jgi:hypothetical protein